MKKFTLSIKPNNTGIIERNGRSLSFDLKKEISLNHLLQEMDLIKRIPLKK